MAKVFTLGIMARSTMESGIKDLNMDMESGEASIMIRILVNGVLQKLRDTVYILGRMETDTKESGSNVSSMAKELIYLLMETSTQESTKTVNPKVRASILGRMALSILVISEMA